MDLKIERVFKATQEQLYNLWTDPQQISEWFCVKVTIDPKIEGKLIFDFEEECGPTSGAFKELDPFNKVSFTWCNQKPYKGQVLGDTLVTINIERISKTESKMSLIHSGFPTQELLDEHKHGWEEYYDIWGKKINEG